MALFPLIAVVDDDDPFLDLMDELLTTEGYRVVLGRVGHEALALIAEAKPDAVIVDIVMETHNAGEMMVRGMRNDALMARLPVLICSADHRYLHEHAAMYHEWGCTILTKPFDLSNLLAALAQKLERTRVVQETHEGKTEGDTIP